MKLVIDCGNTRIKAALFKDGQQHPAEVRNFGSQETHSFRDYVLQQNVTSTLLSTVIQLSPAFMKELKSKDGHFLELDQTTPLPFQNAYQSPRTLGFDRLAAVSGAMIILGDAPLLAINTGSCITYNILDEHSRFTGGAISPGMMMRFQALHDYTGQLPLVKPEEEVAETGTTTKYSILSGVVNGMVIEIEGFIQRYKTKHPGLKTVLGGGDATYLQKFMKFPVETEENLNLYGLKKILDHNEQ